jgi:hypothetical protein
MPRNYIVKAAAALLLAGLTAYNVQAGTLTVRLAESLAPMAASWFWPRSYPGCWSLQARCMPRSPLSAGRFSFCSRVS